MALTYGFYNSVEGDRTYDAIQMGQIFDGIITDGVYATFLKAMVVKASDNPSEVIVQPGRCWFNHTWTYIDADYPVTAPVPEVILDRVDALVIDINTENAFRENSLVWVQGTPSSLNPERPTLIKSVTHNQYPLCYVYRKAGTTMIYAADITNAVGTSETPFVTGVLTGINIDDLLAQWDDEFHTWEAATKTSFEAWMVNQQSVYVTWFDSIKDQMEDDLAGFEAWFETIRGIIDEEAATHLQAEIDDILDMLPAGSHIDISTNEPTLFNRNVTVSDGAHSKTVQFNAIGGATVESFPYIGIIDVSSTDGERIASESLNIPYFGRYSATLAFWSATVNLVGDETLAGVAVTVRDSNGDVVAIVTLNGSGQGVFTATKPDEYKFIYTYGGQTMEVSLAVTQETTYEVEIHGGFRFDQWLLAGRVEEEFDTLDEILADEPTLRQLFLVHDSVDYICDTFSESGTSALEDITKIFSTDLAAKWINLSDYALDHFYAVAGIKSIMDTADKYGYGEWALMPQVPKMTSNTTPYGEASISGAWGGDTTSFNAWKAFNKSSTDGWISAHNTYGWIQYKFVNPICARKIKLYCDTSEGVFAGKVQASNDGTNFVDIAQFNSTTDKTLEVTFGNDNFYSYYRITPTSYNYTNNYRACRVEELEFYAWAPKGNVPVMTDNSVPYGTVSATNSYGSNKPWHVFNPSITTGWHTTEGSTNVYLRYQFTNPVCVNYLDYGVQSNAASGVTKEIRVQGSNDGSTWTTIHTFNFVGIGNQNVGFTGDAKFENDNYYLYYQLLIPAGLFISGVWWSIRHLQFYGRELKVSVPKMTSNTAPYGEVFGNVSSGVSQANMYTATYSDASIATSRNMEPSTNISTLYIGYKFTEKMKPIMAQIRTYSDSQGLHLNGFVVEASNDRNTWNQIASGTMSSTSYVTNVNADETYLYLRVRPTNNIAGAGAYPQVGFSFYGLDYSEKEFEEGTTKKWLYDHGVELVSFTALKGSSTTTAKPINESNEIYIAPLSGTDSNANNFSDMATSEKINLTNYSLFRGIFGTRIAFNTSGAVTACGSMFIWSNLPVDGGSYNDNYRLAYSQQTSPLGDKCSKAVLDISSVNDEGYVSANAQFYNGRSISFTELWLE